MGKGDIRSKRGKIWRGTYGKSRPKKKRKSFYAPYEEAPVISTGQVAAPPPTENTTAEESTAPETKEE